MDCLAKIGGAILGPVFSYMFAPVGHQLVYLFSYKDKMKNLETQVQKLDDKINMVESDNEHAKTEGNAIKGYVQDWQKEATTILEKAKRFLEPDPDDTRVRCSCLWPFPNLALRLQLSKKAEKMAGEVERLIGKVNDFGNNTSYRPAVQLSYEQNDFEKFGSRDETLRKMMEALRNPEVRMIGLCGLGGMGKTMLITEVARLAKEENLFSNPILAVVSQNPDKKKIQQQIADQLGLVLEEDDEFTRAERLAKRLEDERKILIILDDVWRDDVSGDELDLSKVGIRFEDDRKDWKIILTSRDRAACSNKGAEKTTFEIKSLTDEEATDLFKKTVGDIKPQFESLATQVIGECGELPLAIVTIARTLRRHYSLDFWDDALVKLKRSPADCKIFVKIYLCFETSFDALESEEKALLLICSAHGEDENVSLDELTGYVMVLDLFTNVYSLKEASNRVESLVMELKDCSLLLDGNSRRTVKVHDIIRDVAISIASKLEKNPMYCLRQSVKLEDCLKRKNFKEFYAISVPEGGGFNDNQLPEKLACPRLKLLMLRTTGGLEITDRFFEETKELKALRLDVKGGKKLASSFRSLQNLKALHLRIWKEEVDLAIIGELTNLLILDLSDSKFLVALPNEIGKLSSLQVLNLSHCYGPKVIEPNVISRLVKLEELYMEGVNEINASLLSEIKGLPNLRVLHKWIQDVRFVPGDMYNHLNLERYHIEIGPYYGLLSKARSTRVLAINDLNARSLYEDGFQRLMKKSNMLGLQSIPDVSHIVNELDASSFQDLECLELIQLEDLESFMPTSPPTRSIERLTLFNDKVVFNNLQVLTIKRCNSLLSLWASATFVSLQELKKLCIDECDLIEEVLVVIKEAGDPEETKSKKITFPKLESLELYKLPKLKRFGLCQTDDYDTVEFPSLLRIKITDCPELRAFIAKSIPSISTTMEEVGARRMAQEILFSKKVVLSSLQEFTIERCNRLVSVWASATFESLQELKMVSINNCNLMKEVLVITKEAGEHGETKSKKIAFPKLESLRLWGLRKLERIGLCQADDHYTVEFPSLSRILLYSCPEMRTFIAKSIPSTNTTVEEEVVFSNLQELTISWCHSLPYVWALATVENLQQLKKLSIGGCDLLEVVIVITKEAGYHEETKSKKITFPKLESLELYKLPKLKRFGLCQTDDYYTVEFPSLLRIEITNCPELRTFIAKSIPSTSTIVEEVDARRMAQEILFSQKVVPGMSFRNVQELTILEYNNVQYMFSFAMVESLIQLKRLSVSKCEAMEQIVTKAVGEDGRFKNIISFPKLESLELGSLPKLKWFCGVCIEFPSLLKLEIIDCYNLRTFIPNCHESTATLLPALEEREQPLFNEKVVATNLTDLVVWKCHGLISLFNSSTATSLAQLTRVLIGKCNQMTQVIHVNDQMEDESTAESEIVFNQLKILALHCLPNLKRFLSGINELQFPNFEKIILNECPKMSSFSHGTIDTPKLNKLIITELDPRLPLHGIDIIFLILESVVPTKELWEGDLNRSIRKLWDDSCMALQWMFSEIVDDQNFGEDTAGHDQKIQNDKENAASSSSKEART